MARTRHCLPRNRPRQIHAAPYAVTKLQNEKLHGLRFLALRFFSVWDFCERAKMPAPRSGTGSISSPDHRRQAGHHPRRRQPAPRPHPHRGCGLGGRTGPPLARSRRGRPEYRHRQKPLGHGCALHGNWVGVGGTKDCHQSGMDFLFKINGLRAIQTIVLSPFLLEI